MQQHIKPYYDLVKDVRSRKDFSSEIKKRKKEFDDLFSDEVIAMMIVDELDRNHQKTMLIKDVYAGMECTIRGVVSEISDVKTFTRKNKSTGKLRKCILTDESGSVPVILWNDDTEMFSEDHVSQGSMVTIINGYTKKGYHGLEVNVGRWSKIEISESEKKKQTHTHTKEQTMITGYVEDISPTNIFFRDDGSEGFIARLFLKTSKGMQELICWDTQVKHIQQFKKGECIIIENVSYRYANGMQELHVNGQARIKRRQRS